MPDRFKVTKTEENDAVPDYLLEESCTGKLLNDLSDNGKFLVFFGTFQIKKKKTTTTTNISAS